MVLNELFDKGRLRDWATCVLEPGNKPIREHIGVCEEVLTGLVDAFFSEWCFHNKNDSRGNNGNRQDYSVNILYD